MSPKITVTAVSPDTKKVDALRVAIVGHTNTGKTSLIRTLLRDESFGEIDDASGTTRSVERTGIFAANQEVLALYDTPGFEDASALLEAIEQHSQSASQESPATLIQHFVAEAPADSEFDQEIKILLQARNSEVLLYIIDVREPLLGKYADEVSILSMCGKPIIPVFNFIADNEEALQRWRSKMAEFNLHAALEFDTVAFDFEAEKRLYQKLQSVLEPHYDTLQALINARQENWNNLSQAAAARVFDLIRAVACYRQVEESANTHSNTNSSEHKKTSAAAISEMQKYVRKSATGTERSAANLRV